MLVITVLMCVLGAGLAWLLVFARGLWKAKAAAIVLLVGIGVLALHAYDTYIGWPVHGWPPEGCLLDYGLVMEPTDSDPGRVYIWCTPPDKQTSILGLVTDVGDPRAYVIPYSEALHKGLLVANKQAHDGQQVFFSKHPNKGKGKGAPGRRSAKPGFYHLPPPAVPTKRRNQ